MLWVVTRNPTPCTRPSKKTWYWRISVALVSAPSSLRKAESSRRLDFGAGVPGPLRNSRMRLFHVEHRRSVRGMPLQVRGHARNVLDLVGAVEDVIRLTCDAATPPTSR